MRVCTCMCGTVCVCTWWSEERGESSRFGSLSKSRVTGAQTWPQLAPPPTILAFLPLSGTQRVNSNSLLMNWLLKVARQAEPAHLLNTHTHTHTQETKHTDSNTVEKVCCTSVHFTAQQGDCADWLKHLRRILELIMTQELHSGPSQAELCFNL